MPIYRKKSSWETSYGALMGGLFSLLLVGVLMAISGEWLGLLFAGPYTLAAFAGRLLGLRENVGIGDARSRESGQGLLRQRTALSEHQREEAERHREYEKILPELAPRPCPQCGHTLGVYRSRSRVRFAGDSLWATCSACGQEIRIPVVNEELVKAFEERFSVSSTRAEEHRNED